MVFACLSPAEDIVRPPEAADTFVPQCEEEIREYLKNRLPFFVTTVCRRWRTSAMSAEWLWARWSIVIDLPAEEVLTLLDRFVSRSLKWSGKYPLEFSLLIDPLGVRFNLMAYFEYKNTSSLWRIINKLALEQKRWQKATFRMSHEVNGSQFEGYHNWDEQEDVNKFLLLRTDDLLLLEELDLECIAAVDKSPSHGFVTTTLPFPRLRRVSIKEHKMKRPPCQIQIADMERMVSGDRLEALSLRICHEEDPWNPAVANLFPLVLSKLRFLSIESYTYTGRSGPAFEQYLLNSLTCPSLTSLQLWDITVEELQLCISFVYRSSPPLQALEIKMVPDSPVDDRVKNDAFISFLERLPLLTTFRLRFYHPHEIASLLDALSSSDEAGTTLKLVPLLKVIEIGQAEAPVEMFGKLIPSRWNIHPSRRRLHSVTLLACSEVIGDLPLFTDQDMSPRWSPYNIETCVAEGLSFFCAPSINYQDMDE